MDADSPCPQCHSPYPYSDGTRMNCPECGHAWDKETKAQEQAEEQAVVDANGTPLHDGDNVVVVKDLPVKGAPKPVKAGTKVKNNRLVDGDHKSPAKLTGLGPWGSNLSLCAKRDHASVRPRKG